MRGPIPLVGEKAGVIDGKALDGFFDRAPIDGIALRIIAEAETLEPCPCGAVAEIGRTCSGAVTWVACPTCEAEAHTIEDWNAGRYETAPIKEGD